jgi:hypothetical protein
MPQGTVKLSGGVAHSMKEILRTNDPVLLSWAEALLTDARIETIQLDAHTAALEGSISAIQRRLMVADDDYASARRLLDDCDPAIPGR